MTYKEMIPIFGILRTCALTDIKLVDRHSYFSEVEISLVVVVYAQFCELIPVRVFPRTETNKSSTPLTS